MVAKRLFDLVASMLGLVILALPMLLIGMLVRLDSPGPAYFRQTRIGRHGEPFELLKFRTMSIGSGHRGPRVTGTGDTRITRVGRILRASKLDELPQLINVLRGEMSVVGPRPEVPEFVAHYSDDERREILSVRPGITDEAAIIFRNESDLLAEAADPQQLYLEQILPRKLALYRRYVADRSMWLDLQLIVRTVVALFVRSAPPSGEQA